jgi:hypothetical protein
MTFKEVYCHDCQIVLAKYNVKYFTDLNIAELIRFHYSLHIKKGHSVTTRISE